LLQVGVTGSISTLEHENPREIGDPTDAAEFELNMKEQRHSSCAEATVGFNDFMRTLKRTYKLDSNEYRDRKALFERRAKEAHDHNCKPGKHFWTAGITPLADRTDAELRALRGYRRTAADVGEPAGNELVELRNDDRHERVTWPESFSWSDLAAAKQVVDQGYCGSCWASATALMLRAHAQIYGSDRHFSLQQLVSCVPNPEECGGNGGCNGSTGELALDYVMHNGLATETDFPYSARDVACHKDKLPVNVMPMPQPTSSENIDFSQFNLTQAPSEHFGMTGWRRLPTNELTPVFRALYTEGPIATSIEASYSWNLYVRGVMNQCSKDSMVVNHLVVLMGYGSDAKLGVKYWQLQNSWGNTWGESGHIRMIRQDDFEEANFCGWDKEPLIGIGCKGGPSKVWACGSCGVLFDNIVPHFQADASRSMGAEMLRRRNL
jgi:cathepsin L